MRGKKPSPDLVYARIHGITRKQVIRNGGSVRLAELAVNHKETWDYVIELARKARKTAA